VTQYVEIDGGIVIRQMPVPEGFALADCYDAPTVARCVEAPDDVQPNWLTSDGGKTFQAPTAPEPENVVPASVTSAQAKIQLLRSPGSTTGKSLLDDVKSAVDAASGEVEIWFTDARTWERSNPYVAQLGKSLKLKASDIDALFVAAAQIAA
jgi:hypothetical protein